MEWENGFKVLDRRSGKFLSAVQCGFSQVEYKVNEEAKPVTGCGPLTVFKHEKGARKFARLMPRNLVIKHCKYLPSIAGAVWFNHRRHTITQLEKDNPDFVEPGLVALADIVIISSDV